MSDSEENDGLVEVTLKTWTTLDYRDNWGLERIAYDGLSNHFPADCEGSTYQVLFLQDDEGIDFREYNPKKSVDEICFVDDGQGYGYFHLALFYSDKTVRESQTGKFGEGLKLISTASIRHKIDISYGSRDWVGYPFPEDQDVEKEEPVPVLAYKIKEGLERRFGSYTKFRNPPQEFVDVVLTFKERIIDFREDLAERELEGMHEKHRLFVPEKNFEGELFVRKIKYKTDKPLFLTYQINGKEADKLVSPDRDHIVGYELEQVLKKIILGFDEIELIKHLIETSTPECLEKTLRYNFSRLSNDHIKFPSLWKRAFEELYGPNAVLEAKGQANVNADVKRKGHRIVRNMPFGLEQILKHSGVKGADEILDYNPNYQVVDPDELDKTHRRSYDLYERLLDILWNKDSPKPVLYIFEIALNDDGDEIDWFEGMSYYDKSPPEIYLPKYALPDRKFFLGRCVHEIIHVKTKKVDETIEFELGLTNALGEIAYELFVENNPDSEKD